jgi:hypothetical protein
MLKATAGRPRTCDTAATTRPSSSGSVPQARRHAELIGNPLDSER